MAASTRVIESNESRMIHSVFDLGNTIVREVMVPRTDMVFIEEHKTLIEFDGRGKYGLDGLYVGVPVNLPDSRAKPLEHELPRLRVERAGDPSRGCRLHVRAGCSEDVGQQAAHHGAGSSMNREGRQYEWLATLSRASARAI